MSARAETVEKLVKIYRNLTEFPTIVSGRIKNKNSGSDLVKVSSIWCQRNVELGELTKFEKNFLVKPSTSDVLFDSTPIEVSSQELSKFSVSEKYQCVLRKNSQDTKKKQFIEIWTQNGLFRNFDVTAFDVHGEIYTDGEFGTFEWSPSEDKVLYVAEKKPKKSVPFYTQKSENASPEADESSQITGDEYIYKPDWGENLVNKHQPVVGVCDVNAETLKVLEGIPENFSPGQLLWDKDGSGMFGVAFENEPRRLGILHCTNRPNYVFHLTLKGDFRILSDANKSVRSPRLSPDGKSLFWLQRSTGGVHNGCQQLVKLDLASNKKEIVIDIVGFGNKTFSGLFLQSLPSRCFSKDGTKLFFSSCNRYRTCSYYVDLGTKEVHLLEAGDGSSTILDVHDDIVLVSFATLQRPPSLKMLTSLSKPQWVSITQSEIVFRNSVLKELDLQSSGTHKFSYYNALYYGPPPPKTGDRKVPLVLYPHGGPHSASVNDYSFEPNFLVAMGYGVLLVNYRGSTGAGEDGVKFLQGKIGDTDVKDNHEAVLSILKQIPYLDEKHVYLNGKSHGGYLVGQLSAQYPDFYRAVVSGNPVVDVYAMYVMSDIPDWATGECDLPFNESKPLTTEQINKMVAASPINICDKIKAPTLFLIGRKDLRVPFYEGIKMYNALKARKVKVRLNLYDDNHSLNKVPNHIDWVINSVIWYEENRSKSVPEECGH